MRKMKGSAFIIAILYVVIQLVPSIKVKGISPVGVSNKDVVLLIDSSKSMLYSDPTNIRSQAIEEFIQLCKQGDKVGLAAYSENILKEVPVKELQTQEDRQGFMTSISGIELGQWTDIGLALKKSMGLMDSNHNIDHSPIIILLSDGKNDPSRDKKLSEDDISNSAKEAANKGYKIYTIGLNADGTVDKGLLQNLSQQTGGKYFETSQAKDLKDIILQIFADAVKDNREKKEGSMNITGELQNLKFNVPTKNVLEANIVIQSDNGINIEDITDPQSSSRINTDKVTSTKIGNSNDCVIKILTPEIGDWNVSFRGSKGDVAKYNLIYDYDLAAEIKVDPSKCSKGDKIKIEASLTLNNQKYVNKEFIKILKAKVEVKEKSSGSTKEFELKTEEESFSGEYTVDMKGELLLSVKISGDNFLRESNPISVIVQNNAPVVKSKLQNLKISKGDDERAIDLKSSFSDPDGDKLSYKVSCDNPEALTLEEGNGIIKLKPNNKGNTIVTVSAVDEGNESVSQSFKVEVGVKSVLPYIIAAAIAAVVILLLVIRKLRTVHPLLFGKLIVQIRDDGSNITYSPDIIDLPLLKKSTIYQVLRLGPEYQETDKITVSAGKLGNSIILNNKSSCILEEYGIGASGSKVVEIKLNDKLNIVIPAIQKSILLEYYY